MLRKELSREKIWEIGTDVLASAPWSEIVDLRKSMEWRRWSRECASADAAADRELWFSGMERLFRELEKFYPPRKNMRTGWMQVLVADPVGPIVAAAKVFLRIFSEPENRETAEETWVALTPDLLDLAATWIPFVRRIITAHRRRARLEFLYDWRPKQNEPVS